MRLTITEDEGAVFAAHTLDGPACGALLRLLEGEAGNDAASEAAAQEALDDLAAAGRNAA